MNAADRAWGPATVLDILIAPSAAFARLRERPTWVWAFVIAVLLGMIGTFAVTPIVAHALSVELPAQLAASPQMAQIPAEKRADFVAGQLAVVQTVTRFSFAFVPFGFALGTLLQALAMLIANAIGKGDGTFKKFWALAVTAGVIGTGISSIVLMTILLIRGPDALVSTADIGRALPGLGMLVPAGAKGALAFFGVMNVFAIWNIVLLGAGMVVVARIPRMVAIVAALLILLATGLFPLAGALAQK